MTPGHDPVHKISIVARGQAGGVTMYLPEDDTMLRSENDYKARLQVLMGGRAAEQLALNSISTGASDDLQRATKAARAMVMQYGMSKVLGPLTYGQKDEMVFLGKEIGEQRNYSEEAARSIDLEVRRLLQNAHDRAVDILEQNKSKLDEIANKLIVEETIDGADFEAMFA
jgi:cell division protease FtsH